MILFLHSYNKNNYEEIANNY